MDLSFRWLTSLNYCCNFDRVFHTHYIIGLQKNDGENKVKEMTEINGLLFSLLFFWILLLEIQTNLHFRPRLSSSQRLSEVPASTAISSCRGLSPPHVFTSSHSSFSDSEEKRLRLPNFPLFPPPIRAWGGDQSFPKQSNMRMQINNTQINPVKICKMKIH